VLGLLFLLFGASVLASIMRGHAAYQATLFGQPLRLVAYAGIALVLVQADARRLWRGITVVLYAGVGWQLIAAVYHIATGTSQSTAADLSTGGFRVVSIATSLFVASALVAALMNLELDRRAARNALHLAAAAAAMLEIVLAFSRGTFIAVGLVMIVLFVSFERARSALMTMLPLALPVLIAVGIFLPRLETRPNEPPLLQTLIRRLDPHVNSDLSVRWRHEADRILWTQFRANPAVGVGFGKGGEFTLAGVKYRVTQDAHNDYLFLLAAGGLLLLATFLGVVWCSVRLSLQQIRRPSGPVERILATWGLATLFIFLFNGLVEPLIVLPPILLMIWIALLVPVVCARPSLGDRAGAG
jgi:O-antigen ligase